MSESADIERAIAALKKVPERRLLLIELANRIPIMENGDPDPEALKDMQPEVDTAIAEAKMYGVQTLMAVQELRNFGLSTGTDDDEADLARIAAEGDADPEFLGEDN